MTSLARPASTLAPRAGHLYPFAQQQQTQQLILEGLAACAAASAAGQRIRAAHVHTGRVYVITSEEPRHG